MKSENILKKRKNERTNEYTVNIDRKKKGKGSERKKCEKANEEWKGRERKNDKYEKEMD